MNRHIEKTLISRLEKWRAVVLLGARQVGKSYLLREILKKHPGTLLTFDDPLERKEASRDPFKYLEERYQPGKYLFIDEASKVPEIFSAVKILVDQYDPKPTGICLANSGNYLLLRKIKESLAGRVSLLSIYPLSWQEFSGSNREPGLISIIKGNRPAKISHPPSSVNVRRLREERLLWGGFPTPSLNIDKTARIQWIRDYISTYILPLVIEQFNIRETLAFEQAARILMISNGQFLNANKLAQAIGISQPTAMNYTQYLKAMMVVKHAPVYFRNPTKRLIKHPKIYINDPLLVNECLGSNFSLQKMLERDEMGSLYESFIFNEVQKTLSNYDILAESFSWRTQDKAEVDMVLSTRHGLIPVETKWSTRLTRKDTSGLVSFMSCYPNVKKGFIIYPGNEIHPLTENITALPDWLVLGS